MIWYLLLSVWSLQDGRHDHCCGSFRRKIGEGRRRVTSEDVGEEKGQDNEERGSHSRPVYYH